MAIVLGYHGCSKEAAEELVSGSPFLPSGKPYDWLGSGSYFWEWDVLRASQWATAHRSPTACVVGAVIELGTCLDLTTQAGVRAVRDAYKAYVRLQQKAGIPLLENKSGRDCKPEDLVLRYLDKAVIDHLHKNYKSASLSSKGEIREFDTVRALFPEGKPLYENAGFLDKTHVQIAVRREEQILGVFRVPSHQLRSLKLPDFYRGSEITGYPTIPDESSEHDELPGPDGPG